MKVYLYENIDPESGRSLKDSLEACKGLDLVDREKGPDEAGMLLEKCEKTPSGWYQMDFTLRRREHGPGLSRRGEETQDFDLRKDEGFGEQTAAVYSPEDDRVAVQYNHFGPKAGAIVRYLNEFPPAAQSMFVWTPILNRETEARLLAGGIIAKRLNVVVATNGLTAESHAENAALSDVMKMREQTDAGLANITLSLGRGKKGRTLNLTQYVRDLLKADERIIRKLSAEIVNEDESVEILDFLGGRVAT